MIISIYFAGTIAKDHEVMESMWTQEDFKILQDHLSPHTLNCMNPAHRRDDPNDRQSIFGRDMTQVFLADLIFVDGRHRRGLGVGAEMMWAKFHAKPLLMLIPEETYYRKSHVEVLGDHVAEYLHPFVDALCDQIVSTVEEGAEWIRKWANGEVETLRDLTTVYKAMRYYQETQFEQDTPMKEIITSTDEIQKKFQTIPSLAL